DQHPRDHPRGRHHPDRGRRRPRRADGDHRLRLRRAVHGHRDARAGRGGRRPARAGLRRGRHLAGQQLSRCRLRRAVQPLLLLLRTQSRLAAVLLPATGDPGLPAGHRRPLRHPPARRLRRRGHLRALGRRRAPMARADDGRRRPRPVPGLRRRRPGRPDVPRHPRPGGLPGHGHALGPLGPRARPHRRAGGRHRHRRLGHPGGAGHPAGGRQRDGLPAHRALGGPPHRPSDLAVAALPLPARAGAAEGHPRAALRRARGAGAGPGQAAGLPEAGGEAGPGAPGPSGARPEAARRADAGLHDRLQADPDQQRLLPGGRRTQRRARDRGHRLGAGALDRDPRRHRAADGHDRAGDRVPRHRPADRRADRRPRRPHPRRGLEDRHGLQPQRRRRRLPEHVPAGRAQRRGGPHLDGLHDRVAGDLRAQGAGGHGRRGSGGHRDDGGGAAVLPRPHRPQVQRHRLAGRRVRELVPRRARPQHDPLAGLHLPVPAADPHLRPRELRGRARRRAAPAGGGGV
ncbi:MAG: Cyclohexanone monooxygenase, partial [uncultured Blastococcus sp.]